MRGKKPLKKFFIQGVIIMKDVKEYEGLYAITSCGKVWSYKRKKFLKPGKTQNGYLNVSLCKNGKRKVYLIHRLVAEAYLPNPNGLPQINHKNENETINHINNLEWISVKDNINYGSHNERSAAARCKPVYCYELKKTFSSIKEAAEELNISGGNISSCCAGRRLSVNGYHFSFAEYIKEAV